MVLGDCDVGENHPLASELSSLRTAVSRFQDEAYTSSVKLQRHSLDSANAHDRILYLERENDFFKAELATLRANPHPDSLPHAHPAALQVQQLSLSLRRLSDKLSLTEEALLERTTQLAYAMGETSKAKLAAESAYELAARTRGREEAGKIRETELEWKVRAAEEAAKMSDLVVKEYADLVRSLDGKAGARPAAHVKDFAVTTGDEVEGNGAVTFVGSLAEGKLGLQRLLSEFSTTTERLQSELVQLHGELDLSESKCKAEIQSVDNNRVELAKAQFELQQLKIEDNTAAKMVSRYMKFSQKSTDMLQTALTTLKTRHEATIGTLSAQLSQLSSRLQFAESEVEKLRLALDELGGETMKEAYGRRREVALRVRMVNREEKIRDALERWVLRAEEALVRNPGDSKVQQMMIQDARTFLLNVFDGASSTSSGSLARFIMVQNALESLSAELASEAARRLELERLLALNKFQIHENRDVVIPNNITRSPAPLLEPPELMVTDDRLLQAHPTSASKDEISSSSMPTEKVNILAEPLPTLSTPAVQMEDVRLPCAPSLNVVDAISSPLIRIAQSEPSAEHDVIVDKHISDDSLALTSEYGGVQQSLEPSPQLTLPSVPLDIEAPLTLTEPSCPQPPALAEIAMPSNDKADEPWIPSMSTEDLGSTQEDERSILPQESKPESINIPQDPTELLPSQSQDPIQETITVDESTPRVTVSLESRPELLPEGKGYPTTETPAPINTIADLIYPAEHLPDAPVEECHIPEPMSSELLTSVPPSLPSSDIQSATGSPPSIPVTFHPAPPPNPHPLLVDLQKTSHRYDNLQRAFRDCYFALETLATSLSTTLARDSLRLENSRTPPEVLQTALQRLTDYTEDARVELEIRAADEALMARGYEVLLSVPGAISPPTSTLTQNEEDDSNDTPPSQSDVETQVLAFISGEDPSVQKSQRNFSRKLEDIQHDIAALKRAIHDEVISPVLPLTAPVSNGGGGSWASWIRSSPPTPSNLSPASAGPAPTFGNIMTTPRLRHSPSLNFTLQSSKKTPNEATKDPLMSLGLKVPMPRYIQPVTQIPQRTRTVSTMYMLGLGARKPSGSLLASSSNIPPEDAERDTDEDTDINEDGSSDVE